MTMLCESSGCILVHASRSWEGRMTAVGRRGGVLIVAFGMALGCSSGSLRGETIGTTSARAIVTQGSGCTVEWVKMDYREPGGDLSQYIELQVTKGNGLV